LALSNRVTASNLAFRIAIVGASIGLLALAFVPNLDLVAASWFYKGAGHFISNGQAGIIARNVARIAPFALFVVLFLLFAAGRLGWISAKFAPSTRGIVFLALSLALGPGLFVNGVLKDHLHRPRPAQVREFGGRFDFQPYARLDGACPRDCSFPSGEAAAAFWTAAPASLAPLPWRPILTAAALLFGLGTGVLRMAAGGHFLSDVLGAGLIALSVIAALRLLLRVPVDGRYRVNSLRPRRTSAAASASSPSAARDAETAPTACGRL
jgi:lipid A 4'-phosphatase